MEIWFKIKFKNIQKRKKTNKRMTKVPKIKKYI